MSETTHDGAGPLDRELGTIRGARATVPRLGADECPIEALYAEHLNQRQLCAEMDLLGAAVIPRPDLAKRALINLCRDLPAHFEDEERGLFPRLRARALPEDDLHAILARLSREHEVAGQAFALLVPALVSIAEGALPALEHRDALVRLARSERGHLIVENAIVLPLARIRLTAEDKRALMAEMCARRARSLEKDAPCAQALLRFQKM